MIYKMFFKVMDDFSIHKEIVFESDLQWAGFSYHDGKSYFGGLWVGVEYDDGLPENEKS